MRDRKKQRLCDDLGYDLIEFRYDEELTIDVVRSKLKHYLG